jgi:putative membrane protein
VSPGDADETWRRLHPLSPALRAGRGLVPLFAVLAIDLVARRDVDYTRLVIDAVVLAVLLVLGVISWIVTRWRVVAGVLHIETGLLRRRSLRYPLAQVQAIDVVQTGIARLLGLAELRLRMAGGADRGGGRLQGLKTTEAQAVRAHLLELGQRAAAAEPTESAPIDSAMVADRPPGVSGPAAERVLLTVPTGRLLGSVALSGLGIVLMLVLLGTLLALALSPAGAAAAASSSVALLIGLGTGAYRRVNGEYRQTVALAPDGFRLRSGLVETTSETIPFGRVQGVRLVEPLLWQPAGWCRLEVEVAGKRVREENASEGRQRRAILPVGSLAEAAWLLQALVPASPRLDRRPPGRARWKAPLSYRNLGWGANETCVVTRSGRLRRVTHWVPLEKVQSIRRVQGPVQRRFHLAGLHLDSAGRSIHAVIRDEAPDVVAAELRALPILCRRARDGARESRGASPDESRTR